MNNNDIAWVIVRAFGIYFLANAFLDLTSVITYIGNLIELYGEARGLNESDEKLWRVESYIVRSRVQIGMYSLQSISYFLGAFYCLRHGQLIYNLLSYQKNGNEKI